MYNNSDKSVCQIFVFGTRLTNLFSVGTLLCTDSNYPFDKNWGILLKMKICFVLVGIVDTFGQGLHSSSNFIMLLACVVMVCTRNGLVSKYVVRKATNTKLFLF